MFKHLPVSPPRVYLNDFELAINFPREVEAKDRKCVGVPMGGSLPDRNARPMPPEVLSGEPYDPFKLDVWQLGTTFSDFRVSLSSAFSTSVRIYMTPSPRPKFPRSTQSSSLWWTKIQPRGRLPIRL